MRKKERTLDKWTLLINLAGFVFAVFYLKFFSSSASVLFLAAVIPTVLLLGIMSLFHLSSLDTFGKKLLRAMGDFFPIILLIYLEFSGGDLIPISLFNEFKLVLEHLITDYVLPVLFITAFSFGIFKFREMGK